MQRVTDNVKARYRRKGLIASSSTWPPFHTRSFTSLALVYQKVTQLQTKEDAAKIARIRATGDIHKIPELTSLVKLHGVHQIFTAITSGNEAQCPISILIEGHPGIGKTTLVKEICLQWANNQLLTSDQLVLLLMLRDPDVQKITTIEQLVKCTQSTDHAQCVLSYIRNNDGAGVTLIVDGFDELSTELRQASFFRKVIEGEILHNIRVVVTSRPSASACLHYCVQRRIEVLGFEKSSKEQYVSNALKDTPEHLHKLKLHFQQYPNIDALCYIPLNMAIIVYLCLLGSLPPTATKMYESFILHTVCRHLKRVGKIPGGSSVAQTEEFPKPICEVLQQLQKVAFEGLMSDKIVFTVKELRVLCKHDPTCYGVLQSTECYSVEEVGASTQSLNFLHLGFQEYFAAKYITTLPEDEVYTLLRESFVNFSNSSSPGSKSVRLSNMWVLYCGITNGQCRTIRRYLTTYIDHSLSKTADQIISSFDFNNRIISEDILRDQGKVIYLFQCFQEAQDNELCEVLSNSFEDKEICFNQARLVPHQVVSLGFFLSRSQWKWTQLSLYGCHIGDLGMSIIHQYLCGDAATKPDIRFFTLDYNDLTGTSLHLIADIINHIQPYKISLDNNNITSNVKDICTAVANTSAFKVLSLQDNGLTVQEAMALSDMMIYLEELYISNNKLGDHGAKLLSQGIANTTTLRNLSICNNNIGPSGAIAIANALKYNTSLEGMSITKNEVGQDGAAAINKALTDKKTLC